MQAVKDYNLAICKLEQKWITGFHRNNQLAALSN